MKDGHNFVFEQYKNGLYFVDTSKSVETSKTKCLSTVSDNKEYFSQQEIKGADVSRQVQEYLFFPSSNTLKTYVNQNLITNYKINVDDINRAEIVYVPSEPYLEGHMVQKNTHT